MLDRTVVKEFLLEEMSEAGIYVPKGIIKRELVEAFCRFTEEDYYEWLKDNFKSFFNHGNPGWHWIERYLKKSNNDIP